MRFGRALAAACVTVGLAGPAMAKEHLSYAYNLDPTHDALVWAIAAGKVTSDLIDVDLKPVTIPMATQAFTTQQFDASEQGFLLLGDAKARGLPVTMLGVNLRYKLQPVGFGIWAMASSPLHKAEDLKGRTLAAVGLKSTVFTIMRLALYAKHHLNVAVDGGDMRIVEIPGPGMLAALQTGRVDAAGLSHIQSWQARHDPAYREVVDTGADLKDVFGAPVITSVIMGYPDRVNKDPAGYKELLRMLKASSDYVGQHPVEVYDAVAKKDRIDPAFFKDWFANYGDFPIAVTQTDIATINHEWQLAHAIGAAGEPVDVRQFLWSGALMQ